MISVGSFSWEQVTLKDTDTTLIPIQCLVLWCSTRWILCVKAQHACTLCPTFQERSDSSLPTSNKLKLWIVSGAGLIFFLFFFTGISKQTETELAVRQLHGAGRAAVSSHDPSLTQSDWGLQGRLQGRLQSGAGERLETEGRQKQEGKRAQVLYGTFKGHFMVLGLFWRWGGFTEKRWRRGEIMSQIRGRVVTSRCFRVSSQRAGWKLFLLRQHLLNSKDTDTWEIRICSAGKCC